MLNDQKAVLNVTEISDKDVKDILKDGKFVSVIGHKSTADVISQLTGIDIPVNRVELKLTTSDKLVVFQILTRLPEGVILSKEEVDKIPHKWYLVELLPPDETLEALYHW